jgi:dTDP-4-dehydrorhamnose reductase
MRVLVIGDGLLGHEIIKQTGWDFISREKNNIDVTSNENSVTAEMIKEYDTIVNCIAYTKTYEQDFDNAWSINCVYLNKLIEITNMLNQKLIHISTDYIYANSVTNASEEDVPVHLGTWYGYTKLVGDALVQLRSKNYLICRLSHKPYPYPYDNAWVDIKTNGDFVNVISEMVINLIRSNENGVYNVGTEEKSIYDMVKKHKSVNPSKKPIHVPYDTTMNVNKYNIKYKNKL